MTNDSTFRLSTGSTGPVQQSSVTCGSASLTVARMLVNPDCAHWIVSGRRPSGGAPDGRHESERFGEYERVVMNRTNGIRAGGGVWNVPWPHALGTPPWGGRAELEYGAAAAGSAYEVRTVRQQSREGLRASYAALTALVREGLPALLYVGNTWLPRHVTLVLPGDGDDVLDVYDPATGTVTELPQEAFAGRRLRVAGWDTAWFLVQPRLL